jgi:hypothetical protein
MKQACWITVIVLMAPVGTALAQSASAAPASDEPASEATPPAASEPTLPPEHVGAAKPALLDEPTSRELTLDRIVLSATNRIDLNLFGDVSLLQLNDNDTAFVIGPVGVQITAHLADHLVGRTEWVVKFDAGGATVIDLERLYLEYRTDHWAFVAGKTHSEFGYWNTAFHHGTWLQLTKRRPRVVDFEQAGGVLATHSTGVTASYGPKRGDSGVELLVAVGNGHGRTLDTVLTESDNNAFKSVLIRLGAIGFGDPALRFGVNVAVDEIAPEPVAVRPLLPDRAIQELVTGFYLAFRGDRVLVFSETYNILHHSNDQNWQFTDGFLLAGYRFGQFTPYGEIEARYGDGAIDPYYQPDPAVDAHIVKPANFVEGTAGVRYELNTWSALKLELAAASFADRTDYRAELNWSFGR